MDLCMFNEQNICFHVWKEILYSSSRYGNLDGRSVHDFGHSLKLTVLYPGLVIKFEQAFFLCYYDCKSRELKYSVQCILWKSNEIIYLKWLVRHLAQGKQVLDVFIIHDNTIHGHMLAFQIRIWIIKTDWIQDSFDALVLP